MRRPINLHGDAIRCLEASEYGTVLCKYAFSRVSFALTTSRVCLQLEDNLVHRLMSLVHHSDSDFWRNGRFLLNTGRKFASHKDGEFFYCDDVSTPIWTTTILKFKLKRKRIWHNSTLSLVLFVLDRQKKKK